LGELYQLYAVWGDTNGGVSTGEASIALASNCFPNGGMSGNNGYTGHDILYLAFANSSAVPGKDGAAWTASSFADFEQSLVQIGDALVAQIPSM
jgi:chitosanase